jgi:hypothetical protein
MSAIAAAVALAVLVLSPATATVAKKVCRDAKTGQYVSAHYAKKYPGLTVCEVKK